MTAPRHDPGRPIDWPPMAELYRLRDLHGSWVNVACKLGLNVRSIYKHLETAEPKVQVERLRVEVTRLRAFNKRAVELLWLLDRPEARHPDVAEFLDGLGDL